MTQAKDKPKDKPKEWVHYEQDEYAEAASGLAMFNSKLVNTNAPLTWVRLDSNAAIDLPYVSVRTLMSRGFDVPLDCPNTHWENLDGQKVYAQKVYRQMSANDGDYDSVPSDELREAKKILQEKSVLAGSGNTSFVDRRLRQILLRKRDTYVSITPLPSSGLSQVLFSQGGLVHEHNALIKAGSDSQSCKIRLASLKYGGSNSQNASFFTGNIQNLIFVPVPSPSESLRKAFALFYQGVRIDFERDSELSSLLKEYCDFRARLKLDDSRVKASSNIRERDEEKRLIGKIAKAVLSRGKKARQEIEANIDKISGGMYERIEDAADYVNKQTGSAVMTGLLIPSFRSHDWPFELAKFIYMRMSQAKGRDEHGITFDQLVLDSKGEGNLLKTLENEIRCSI